MAASEAVVRLGVLSVTRLRRIQRLLVVVALHVPELLVAHLAEATRSDQTSTVNTALRCGT